MPIFNAQSFNDTLTKDIVSFEQLGTGLTEEHRNNHLWIVCI